MSKPLQRIAVILPIALLVVMIGRAEWQLEHSQTWHFAIRGYDPRDLLRGHYLRFNLAVQATGTSEACGISDPDCCYCLSEGPQLEANATVATCGEAIDQCDAFVRTAPLHSLDRFYIPEAGRSDMEARLREAAREGQAHLAVAVSSEGEPMIEALLLNGVPIEAAAESGPNEAGDRR